LLVSVDGSGRALSWQQEHAPLSVPAFVVNIRGAAFGVSGSAATPAGALTWSGGWNVDGTGVQQFSPFQASRPSLSATAAMTRAATGSAQDQPSVLVQDQPQQQNP